MQLAVHVRVSKRNPTRISPKTRWEREKHSLRQVGWSHARMHRRIKVLHMVYSPIHVWKSGLAAEEAPGTHQVHPCAI